MPGDQPYNVYREQLLSLYHGIALWEPNPIRRLYDLVSIGDVGYMEEGFFHRMFNVTLPLGHGSNERLGELENYTPLNDNPSFNIRESTLAKGEYYSRNMSLQDNTNYILAKQPDDTDGITFTCQGQGALLSLPHIGHRKDVIRTKVYEDYVRDNVDSWFEWSKKTGLGVERMEDLILVTGYTLATSWGAAVFVDHHQEAGISLATKALPEGGASFKWSRIRGSVQRHDREDDPQKSNPPALDQCVFIKGFRAKRRLFRTIPMRAAAGPLPDKPDDSYEDDVQVIRVPDAPQHRDPLVGVLDYLVEKCPENTIAIAHDDDLQLIKNVETLTADTVEMFLHESQFPVLFENGAAILDGQEGTPSHYHAQSSPTMPSAQPSQNTSPSDQLASQQSLQQQQSRPQQQRPQQTHQGTIQTMRLRQAAAVHVNADQQVQRSNSLPIPSDILTCILLYLSPHDIISCRRSCRTLYGLCNYPILRYIVQMERSAVINDIRSGLGYYDRLRILMEREEGWEVLDFRRSVQLTVPFGLTGIYDLTGGAFLLGTTLCNDSRGPTVGYSYLSLPSLANARNKQLEWKEFSLGIQILDVGLAVHEHDLIAALTTTADPGHPSDRNMTLEIRLLCFSTGQPHPLAEEPIIFVTTKSLLLGRCNVVIKIVGEFLVLLITFPWAQGENEDMFFLVRWKKGEIHRLRTSESRAYTYFSFLSKDTLVMPNLIQNTLEVAKVVIDSDNKLRLVTLCVLHLPTLTRRASIVRLGCRAEPNPTDSDHLAVPAPSDRPFYNKAEDAVVLFKMLIEDVHLHAEQSHLPVTRPFTFIVHRCALLSHIPATHRAYSQFYSSPEPAADPPVQVPWATWGPAATRWFEGDPASIRWITTTAGQRVVTMEDRVPTPIIVRDFNPYVVRSVRARTAASGKSQRCNWSEQLPNGNRLTLKVEDSVLLAGSLFMEDVRSSLPYIEIVTQAEYHYKGVLIDEESILGLKTSEEDELRISSVDIHVLG